MIAVILFFLSLLSFILAPVAFYFELNKGTKPRFVKLFVAGIILFIISEILLMW